MSKEFLANTILEQSILQLPKIAKNKGLENLLNALEPADIIQTFLDNPPLDFSTLLIEDKNDCIPAFCADFNLLTTLDDEAKKLKAIINSNAILKRLITFSTMFLGTTASEYANYPERENYQSLVKLLIEKTRAEKVSLFIIKDVPRSSPLLTNKENECAEKLINTCEKLGFAIVSGQALAYVPIDFDSIDEFLMRMSKSRRKEFRKKLKESAHIEVSELESGNKIFFQEDCLNQFYEMYLNVFKQSEIHFDILSLNFFRELLQNKNSNAKVFLYKSHEKLIAYNICFINKNCLVDKYIGFVYPDARLVNLYFKSWFYNLEFAKRMGLSTYIAGWTDPAVKKSLGAKFTFTTHAVYIPNPILRTCILPFKKFFESDQNLLSKQELKMTSGTDKADMDK